MTAYIKLSTGEFPRHIGDIELDPAGMSDYAPVKYVEAPEINRATQAVKMAKPVNEDGVWRMAWEIKTLTTDEIAKREIRRKEMMAKIEASKSAQPIYIEETK